MTFFRVFLLMSCLLAVCSCRSQPEMDFNPSSTIQCLFSLVRKNGVLVLETKVRKETNVRQMFSTNTQHIPPLAVKPGEWNTLSVKQGESRAEQVELLLDGKTEKFLYPGRGIFLKVFPAPRKDGSYALKGYFRRAVVSENRKPLEYIAVPFQLILHPGEEKLFFRMEY